MEDIILFFIYIISAITLPAIVIALVVYADYKLTHYVWQKFAGKEGLNFYHGNILGLKDIKPCVKGLYRGLDFKLSLVDIFGKRKSVYTSIVMKLPVDNSYNLTICPSYPFQRFATGLFDSAAITRSFSYEETVTDDPEFDSSFIVTGSSDLMPLFTPELRKTLLDMRDLVNISIDRETITYETSGVIRNLSFLNCITEVMYYMAVNISRINSDKDVSRKKELQIR
ncbi:MAG: hypothetical protein ABRQ39_21560 [Candidatus Eremiobacterota bacterium]